MTSIKVNPHSARMIGGRSGEGVTGVTKRDGNGLRIDVVGVFTLFESFLSKKTG